MQYGDRIDYNPNPKRKEAAVKLLDKFKNIMEDVKSRLPFDADDWAIAEETFGTDQYTSGYYRLGQILVKIRDKNGGEISPQIIKSVISLVNEQVEKLLDFSMSRQTPFSNRTANYGIIIARKMRMLTKDFENAILQTSAPEPEQPSTVQTS